MLTYATGYKGKYTRCKANNFVDQTKCFHLHTAYTRDKLNSGTTAKILLALEPSFREGIGA